ncbi:MAG: site-2 protease family protein [Acidobacteria bacterium]|nr:site-2 protease family protein [Acidobacteriota bacterium]
MHPPSGPDGPSSLPISDPVDRYDDFVPVYVPRPLPPAHGRLWVQLVLLGATVITTTLVGGSHYYSFAIDLATVNDLRPELSPTSVFLDPMFWVRGLWYSLTILAILGCHEMGHYLACLRYGVEATRPYFLPAPLPLTGTLGAFIRIRSRIPSKIALFDIGIAGPLAGFIVAVPALFIGLWLSRVDRLPADASNLVELGEPLLFRLAAWIVWGDVADGYTINMHPMAFAAWFGLLATALNLFPIAQLDGGHISYAVFGRRSTVITIVMIGVAIGLTFVSSSWIAWTVLLVIMIAMMGPRHPPTLDEDESLDRGRLLLAVVALVVLIVCFTPAPIGPFLGAP